MFGRKKIAMIVAEFLGTGILTMLVLNVSRSSLGLPFFIAMAAGLVVVAMTLVLGPISGAHFNPAITLGLWSARRIKTLPALVYVGAQLVGAAGAYLLYAYFVDSHWHNSGHFQSRVLVAEALGAFIFSLGWAAAAYQRLETGRAAAIIGVSLVVGMLAASVASGGLINPAVALGARAWVWGTYVLGPVLGAIIGFNLYGLLFATEDSMVEHKPKKK